MELLELEGYIVTPGGVEMCKSEEAQGDGRPAGGEAMALSV